MTPEESDAMMRKADAEAPGCLAVTALVLVITAAGMVGAAYCSL